MEPAPEYHYLVDMGGWIDEALETNYEMTGYEDSDMAEFRDRFAEFVELEDIMAEADDKYIHAQSHYLFHFNKLIDYLEDMGGPAPFNVREYSPLAVLADAGPAEVELPLYFPEEYYLGHYFIGNPGKIVSLAYNKAHQLMDEMAEEDDYYSGSMGMDMMLGMLGISNVETDLDWLGDEFVLFLIANPGFDPAYRVDREMVFDYYEPVDEIPYNLLENPPAYPLLGLGSADPGKGLDTLQRLLNTMFMMSPEEIILDRGEYKGHDALMFDLDAFVEQLDDYEEDVYFATKIFDVYAPSIAIALDDYLLIGSYQAVDTALEMWTETRDEGPVATTEIALNLGKIKTIFESIVDGWITDIMNDPETGDYDRMDFDEFMEEYDDFRQFTELGMNRGYVSVESPEAFMMDTFVSHDLIDMVDLITARAKGENEPYEEETE